MAFLPSTPMAIIYILHNSLSEKTKTNLPFLLEMSCKYYQETNIVAYMIYLRNGSIILSGALFPVAGDTWHSLDLNQVNMLIADGCCLKNAS